VFRYGYLFTKIARQPKFARSALGFAFNIRRVLFRVVCSADRP
jgi:hypothetical protein